MQRQYIFLCFKRNYYEKKKTKEDKAHVAIFASRKIVQYISKILNMTSSIFSTYYALCNVQFVCYKNSFHFEIN